MCPVWPRLPSPALGPPPRAAHNLRDQQCPHPRQSYSCPCGLPLQPEQSILPRVCPCLQPELSTLPRVSAPWAGKPVHTVRKGLSHLQPNKGAGAVRLGKTYSFHTKGSRSVKWGRGRGSGQRGTVASYDSALDCHCLGAHDSDSRSSHSPGATFIELFPACQNSHVHCRSVLTRNLVALLCSTEEEAEAWKDEHVCSGQFDEGDAALGWSLTGPSHVCPRATAGCAGVWVGQCLAVR